MMIEYPDNIVELMEYHRKERDWKAISQREPQMQQRLDKWMPFREITLEEAESFLENQFGLVKTELDEFARSQIPGRLEHVGSKHQYVCSYVFPDNLEWQKWATSYELEMYELSVTNRTKAVNERRKKLLYSGKQDEKEQFALELDLYYLFEEKHMTVHVLTDDGVHFTDYLGNGLIPKLVRFSLLHLLGRAPTPEETYSEWPMYAQFLMDISYI